MVNARKKNIDLATILAFLVVARLSCSALSNIPFMSIAFVFVYGVLFCLLFLLRAQKISRNELWILIVLMIYAVYVASRSILAGRGLFSTDAFNAYTLFFLAMIYLWVKEQPTSTQSNLFKLILFACIFNYVYSIIVLFFDPNASRTAAATSVLEASEADILNAVGSFDAVYGAVFIIPLMALMRKKMEKNKKRLLITLVLILAIAFVMMAAYATAIIMLLLTLFIYLGSKNGVRVFIGGLVVITLLIFHTAVGGCIMDASETFSFSKMISVRMKEFGYMIKSFETAGTYAGEEGRLQKMLDSLNTFLRHPIFGGYGMEGAKIGGHSEFCDMLGKYGLVGFSLIVAFFVLLYKEVRGKMENRPSVRCLNIIFVLYGVLTVLNPALYALLVLPLILMLPLSKAYMENARLLSK